MKAISSVRLTAASLCLLTLALHSPATRAQHWFFDVFLDGDAIGYHHFSLQGAGEERVLQSEARFKVRVLSIPIYRYKHDAREIWNGDCLKTIEAQTDDNGKRRSVSGRREQARFIVDTPQGQRTLPECIMSFAYWDTRILEAERLLNAQTGDYLDIRVEHLGGEALALGETTVMAERYRLSGDALEIDLWYAPNRQWLALSSTTASGRVLSYKRQLTHAD